MKLSAVVLSIIIAVIFFSTASRADENAVGGVVLDDTGVNGRSLKIIRLSFASLNETAALLGEIKSPAGKVAVNEEARSVVLMDTPDRIRMMEALIAQMDIQTVTIDIPLKFSRADEVLDRVRPLLTQSVGMITSDMQANKIAVTDTPAVVERVRRVVEALDPRGRKIILEAKLVHVVLDDEHLDGIDWSGIVSDHQNFRLEGRYRFLGGKNKGQALSLGTIEGADFVPLIEALDTVGVIREYPLVEVPVSPDNEIRMAIFFNDPGVSLEVVDDPSGNSLAENNTAIDFVLRSQVDIDGTLKTTIAEHAGAGANEPHPILSRKVHNATVRSQDGGSIVFGGIIGTEQVLTQRKIPLMGDIPLLGFAFRYHNSAVRREEFVVFLTPRIVASQVDGSGTGLLKEQVK